MGPIWRGFGENERRHQSDGDDHGVDGSVLPNCRVFQRDLENAGCRGGHWAENLVWQANQGRLLWSRWVCGGGAPETNRQPRLGLLGRRLQSAQGDHPQGYCPLPRAASEEILA